MEIIKRCSIKRDYKELICNRCGSILGVYNDDWKWNFDSTEWYVKCPVCGEVLREKDVIQYGQEEDTRDPFNYPNSFVDYSDGVDVSEEEINNNIREGLNYLIKHQDEILWFSRRGNTYCCVYRIRDEQEYDIFVTKSFKKATIDYGDVDIVLEDLNNGEC